MRVIKSMLDKLLGSICVALLAFLVVLVTWQVFTRFVLNNPNMISEELAQYCFVWLVLYGSAYVFGESGHMAIEFIKEKFPQKIKTGIELLIQLVIIVFAALVLIKGGLNVTALAWSQLSPSLQIPVGYLYTAIPISGAFTVIYCINHMYLILTKKEPA